jgi:hypothetical protein
MPPNGVRSYVQVGFKSFLNVTPAVTHSQPPPASPRSSTPASGQAQQTATATGSQPSFTLTLDENPLAEFVELPEEAIEGGLWFSNVLCGVLRGALEMVRLRSETTRVLTMTRTGSNTRRSAICF